MAQQEEMVHRAVLCYNNRYIKVHKGKTRENKGQILGRHGSKHKIPVTGQQSKERGSEGKNFRAYEGTSHIGGFC